MAKKQQSAQTQDSIRSDVFVIENYTDKDGKEQARWIRVGVAFRHNDNKGFNLKCTALPINGELVPWRPLQIPPLVARSNSPT